MVSKKSPFQYLIIGLLLVLTVLPSGFVRADVGLPPAQPGSSFSPGEFDNNVKMVPAEGSASVSPTPPLPTATTSALDPTGSDVEPDSPNAAPSVPFSFIMGGGFITTAVVLIIIAVKRGEKKE